MKKLLILFSILFCLKNMQAQNTCATALNFTVAPFDPVESQTQSAKWYKFTSKSTKVRYKLRFSSNSGSGQPNKIILWGGSCGSLVQMGEDTITSITDSVLEIVNMSISNSTNYYIEIRKLNSTDTVNYFQTLNFRVLSPECTDCPSSSCELLCNGSFEANYGQPVGITNNSASDLSTCGWENFNMASPDYFTTSGTNGAGIPNTLFGNQTARTGNAMTGFFAGSYNGGASHPSGWHEYIYQALQTPLTANVTYTLSFYVKPSTNTSNAGHFANSIGAWFPNSSDLAPNNGPQSINYQILGVTPQVMYNGFINNTSDWTLVTGTFTATGLEEYIVIGNFGSTYNVSNLFKSYYFLDDVSLSTAALCSLSPIGSNNIPNNANVSTQFGGATTLTNQNIKVNGVFNIDANLILVGCNVVMAPDAKINVLNGKSLTIKGKTHVGGCCELWDGIYVQNGGIVNVEESSIIEDANKAIVVAQGGYLNSKVAIFNRNRTSIEFTSNANTTAPAVINTTLFTCRKLPLTATISSNPDFFATLSKLSTYAATTTKPQTVTAIVEKSPYGISATDVNFLSVGTSGIQNYMNYFDQLQIGVNLLRSNCEIYNNTFQNLLNSTVCFGCQNKKGIGVFSQGTAAGTNSITIGGNSVAYQGNRFYNCYRGIELNDYQKNFIIKNTIDN
ncbi:MAG: hypothetical protein L6Q66_04935, partial [Bacteroidia bacterium]|nr:hypothetical protein [Bacteroidia bacterium]